MIHTARFARGALLCALFALLCLLTLWRPAQAATGDPLDMTRLGPRPVWSQTFRVLPLIDGLCNAKLGQLEDQYAGEGSCNTGYPRTHGEHECYSDLAFNGYQPFSLVGGAMAITAARSSTAAGACAGTTFKSGMVETQYAHHQVGGYWHALIRFPAGGKGRWPAFWLKSAAGWPPEVDIAEIASGILNGSQHSKARPGGFGTPSAAAGCLCDKPHDVGVLIDPKANLIVWYLDGKEWQRQVGDPGVTSADYFAIVNLAISGSLPGQAMSWTGQEDASSTPAQLFIYSIEAWTLR